MSNKIYIGQDLLIDPNVSYTKAETDQKISDLVDLAPDTLDTLNELAAALGDDANFATTITDSIDLKADDSDVFKVSDSSSAVVNLLDASNASEARDVIGAIAYPYTTDFQAGVEQTRDLSTITPATAGYNNNIDLTSVYVGSNVTTIGNYAFSNFNSNLAFVSLPETITSIGANAFDGISSLENLRIPSSVTSFGAACFRDSGLVDITFPAGIQVLEWYGMNRCASLQSATISDGIEIIRNGFFSECTSLQSIEIPNSVYRIDGGAFRDCTSLESVTLPTNSSYTTVANSCFGDCISLLSIDIPASVTLLDNSCFANCISLSTINCYATSAPSTVIDTFHNVAATEIHVPVGATGYGDEYETLTVIRDL